MKKAHRIPFQSGDEHDALSRGKRYYHWKAGERKRQKRIYNKRQRRWMKRKEQEE